MKTALLLLCLALAGCCSAPQQGDCAVDGAIIGGAIGLLVW